MWTLTSVIQGWFNRHVRVFSTMEVRAGVEGMFWQVQNYTLCMPLLVQLECYMYVLGCRAIAFLGRALTNSWYVHTYISPHGCLYGTTIYIYGRVFENLHVRYVGGYWCNYSVVQLKCQDRTCTCMHAVAVSSLSVCLCVFLCIGGIAQASSTLFTKHHCLHLHL